MNQGLIEALASTVLVGAFLFLPSFDEIFGIDTVCEYCLCKSNQPKANDLN